MMKKAILSFGLCFLLVFVLSAQESGQITLEKKGLKKSYLLDGESVDSKQIFSLLESNSSSASKYKASKTYSIVGVSSLAVGTVFIGVGFYYTLKSAGAVGDADLVATTDYSNKSTNNMLLGAAFYVLSVPFMVLSNSNFKKSINLYNASSGSADLNDVDLYFGFTNDGLGVGLRF
jgi:hypothetical protein